MLQANPVNPLCARLFSSSAPIEAYPVFGSISLHRNDKHPQRERLLKQLAENRAFDIENGLIDRNGQPLNGELPMP
jgi:hypothetical protein